MARVGSQRHRKKKRKKLLSDTVLVLKEQNYMLSQYSCLVLMKLEFSRYIFEKYSNIKFHEIPSSASRVVPCGRAHVA